MEMAAWTALCTSMCALLFQWFDAAALSRPIDPERLI